MIATWTKGAADDHMAESILVELATTVRRHPWWRARTALTLDLLKDLGAKPPARVLDAGCGWGSTLDALERSGYGAVGLDVARNMLERLDREKRGRDLVEGDLTVDWPGAASPRLGSFDAVLALDVIEHLDGDRDTVARLGQMAKPGGVVVASVPALPDLFGEFDAVQGHRRRYLPQTLRAAFDGTGLNVERLFWWGSWMVPVVRRQRSRKLTVAGEPADATYQRYLRLPPWPAPLGLRLMFALEHKKALRQGLTTGTSLFAVARRPA